MYFCALTVILDSYMVKSSGKMNVKKSTVFLLELYRPTLLIIEPILDPALFAEAVTLKKHTG